MESSQKDLYSVLNVPRTATPEQIRSAYRELTKAFLGSTSDSNEPLTKSHSLQDISTAYNVLSNPIKRAEYDAQYSPLVESPTNGFATRGSQPENHATDFGGDSHFSPYHSEATHHHADSTSSNPERIGRGNNTEFITNKPAAAFAAGTGLRGPFGITDSHLARSDSHKIKPMKDMLGPIFSDRKRMPPGVLIAIITGSLSIGIIIALVVRSIIGS